MLADDEDMAEPPPPSWTSEPTTLQDLLDTYIVEQKVSGRHPGVTLYLTVAAKRDGSVVDVLADQQKYKLFLDSWIYIVKRTKQLRDLYNI